MPLFKSFRAPNATISVSTDKDKFTLGETVQGIVGITSQEDIEANEIRVELAATERVRPGGGFVRDQLENVESRMYSQITQNAPQTQQMVCSMYRGQTLASPKLMIPKGCASNYPFKISIPQHLGPTFQGTRKDGRWLQRTWTLKAVLAVGGRPDVDTAREICVVIPPPQSSTAMWGSNVVATSGSQGVQVTETIPVVTHMPTQVNEVITSCSQCGAPINPSQEDLIVTCRYCGFSVKCADSQEIKCHSMIENNFHTQQAVEAAQKFMDKGIFRSGVAQEANITTAKLRYLPFWTFPVAAYTQCSGVTGAGLTGEMQQVENVLSDKRASMLSKVGGFLKAGAGAYFESKQRNQAPRTVSHSFSSHYDWPILARKSAITEINYYDVPVARKIPFDVGRIPAEAEFLNAEYKQEEAKIRVKAEVENKERSVACGKVDTLQSCNTNITIGDGELVHAPVWFVHYTFKAENYMILVDGSIGKVLGGGKPLFHI